MPLSSALRSCVLLIALLSLVSAATAQTKVKESDYQTYVKLSYAKALFEQRKTWARGNEAKLATAEAELNRIWKETSWTQERFGQVDEALGEVVSTLRAEKTGDLTPDDIKAALAECDPTTVATVRAHFDDLENPRFEEKAEKQVREELQADRAGEPPTETGLQGTWTFDADASLDWVTGGLGGIDRAKLQAEIQAKTGTLVYRFGPGSAVEVRSKGSDGAEKVEKGTFRIQGRTVFFKVTGSNREYDLQAGMRNGKLLLGQGSFMGVYRRN